MAKLVKAPDLKSGDFAGSTPAVGTILNYKRNVMYKQCELKYENNGKSVFWVENKFAKAGKVLIDKDLNKKCVVNKVFQSNEISNEQMTKMQHMFKTFMDHDGAYK